MRGRRWLAAVLGLVVVASVLGLALSGGDDPAPTTQPPAGEARPLTGTESTEPPADTPSATDDVGRAGRVSPRQAEGSEFPVRDVEGPARAARRATDPATIVVRFLEGVTAAEMEAAVRAAGAEPLSTIPEIGTMIASVEGSERDETEAVLELNPLVDTLESNHLRYALADPNDEGYYDQLHILVSRLPIAWELTKGSADLDIAILDTGVDLDHPDLAGRMVPGYDFANNDAVPMDDDGHGTMVAGIAAADTNNLIGVAGAAWNARIMPVKVLGADGSGTDGQIANGIVWAVDHGAEVINLSLGGPGSSTILADAVDYATSRGVVVVAAAGNESTSEPSYPAAIPDVIAVGATDLEGNAVSFTNFGPWVDLVAPGTDIVSTLLAPGTDAWYGIGDGTSFAAPIVAGVAALVRATSPSLTPAQVTERILGSASDRGPGGIDDVYGRGLLDAYGAVGGRTAASPPAPSSDALEPNDVADRASALTGSVQATISPEGDVDWYAVDVPEPGTISLTVTPPLLNGLFGVDPVIEGFSPDLRSLGLVDATGLGLSETIEITALVAGRYSFRVSNYAGSREPRSYSVDWSFTAGSAQATEGDQLWVRSADPADFDASAEPDVAPSVTFVRDLDPASVGTSTARIRDGKTGSVVPSSPSYDAETRTITLVPDQPLGAGPYLIDIAQVVDTNAQTMTAAFRSRFTVASQVTPEVRADVNGDGFSDVLIGAPTEDIGSRKDAGAFHVMYGSAAGARTSGSQIWTQNTPNVPGGAEAGDLFGATLATGDVNDDGYDDVAVGVPGEGIGSKNNAGAVHLFLGSPTGLRALGSQLWTQDSPGVPGAAEAGDRFGSASAMGDFDNIRGDDLAVGSPTEGIGVAPLAGAVHYLSGRAGGLTGSGSRILTQKNIYGLDVPHASFGAALAAGDFDGDTHDDLAVGAPNEDLDNADQGTVTLLRGTVVGLRPIGALWSELLTGSPAARSERFGSALASGDFGGLAEPDGYADLAIGVPGADAGAGRVEVLFSDWLGAGVLLRTARQTGNGNVPEAGDGFGAALSSAHFGGSPTAWLAIGVPGEDIGSAKDAGAVHVVAPTSWATGPVTVPAPITQDSPGVRGVAESSDRFGYAVGMAEIDGDGSPDVVVGSPTESFGSQTFAGAAYVLRGVQPGGPLLSQYIYQGKDGVPGGVESGDRFGAAVGP